MRGGRVLRSIGGRDVAGLLGGAELDDEPDLAAFLDSPDTDPAPTPAPEAREASAGMMWPLAEVPSVNASLEKDGHSLDGKASPSSSSSSSSPWWPALGFVTLGEVPEATSSTVIASIATSTPQTSATTSAAGPHTNHAGIFSNTSIATTTTTTSTHNLHDLLAPGNLTSADFPGRVFPFLGGRPLSGEAQVAHPRLTTEVVASALASRVTGLNRSAEPPSAQSSANFEDAFGGANVSEEQALAAAFDLAKLWNTEIAVAARRMANSTDSSSVPADLLDQCEAGLVAIAKLSSGALPPSVDGFDMSSLHWRGFCAQLAQRLAETFEAADAAKAANASRAVGRQDGSSRSPSPREVEQGQERRQ